jgi:triacylglycerol esterase/lipase EstA (alpha/beta hydrolase family)
MDPLMRGLKARGFGNVVGVDLRPSIGTAPIMHLAEQLRHAVDETLAKDGAGSASIVGFSMGALVSRAYIQRLGGKERVSTFVSISGPHRGTAIAHASTLLGSVLRGVHDMRPGSKLLRDLASDQEPWGQTRVHCMYTPWDLMIVPPTSSILDGAESTHRLDVKMHRFMVEDARVHDLTARLLRGAGDGDSGERGERTARDVFADRE